MKRLFWVSIGVGITVYVMSKGRKVVKQYAPEAVIDRASEQASAFTAAASSAAGGFLHDFKAAFAERESELTDALLADTQGSVHDLKARRAEAVRNKNRPQYTDAKASDFPDVDPEEQDLGYSF